jgi:hypothetical protein
MQDTRLIRRQFLGGAGVVAVAMAARPALADEGILRATASDDAPPALESGSHDRVALLCVLRGATARG